MEGAVTIAVKGESRHRAVLRDGQRSGTCVGCRCLQKRIPLLFGTNSLDRTLMAIVTFIGHVR